MAAVIPWATIRKEYVEGRRTISIINGLSIVYPTYEELATRYTIGLSTVRTRGAKEKWPEQRKAFQEQQATEAEARQERRASLLELDEAAIACAARGIAAIDALFARFGADLVDTTQTKRQIRERFVDLEELSHALLNFQAVGQHKAA